MDLGVQHVRYDAHHPVFDALAEEATLWRFLTLPKLLSLLEYGALHFARVDTLDDPFEGELTDAAWAWRGLGIDEQGRYVDLQKLAPSRDHHELVLRQYMRRTTLVSCWNHSEHELDALWGRYASMDYGLAIRTSFGRLTTSFGTPFEPNDERSGQRAVYVGRVHYVDYATAVWPAGNAFWPFVHKRLSFSSDNEVRALICDPPRDSQGDLETDHSAESLLARVDLERLIAAVVISPKAPNWFAQVVERLVRRYGIEAPVARSVLSEPPRRDGSIRAINLIPDEYRAD